MSDFGETSPWPGQTWGLLFSTGWGLASSKKKSHCLIRSVDTQTPGSSKYYRLRKYNGFETQNKPIFDETHGSYKRIIIIVILLILKPQTIHLPAFFHDGAPYLLNTFR